MVQLSTSALIFTLTSLLSISLPSTTAQPHGGSDLHGAIRRHAHQSRGEHNAQPAVAIKREAFAAELEVAEALKMRAAAKQESKRKRMIVRRAAKMAAEDRVYKRDDAGNKVCKWNTGSAAAQATTTTDAATTASSSSATPTTTSPSSAISAWSSATPTSSSSSWSSASSSDTGAGLSVNAALATAPWSSSTDAPASTWSSSSVAWSSPAPSSSSAAPAPSSNTGGNWTPNGNKAGVAGGDSLPWIASELGWWYDWSAGPYSSSSGSAMSVPMLWGDGNADSTDASRLQVFEQITSPPQFIIGFEEPDCPSGAGSAGFDYQTGATLWNKLVAPLGNEGSVLLSPSMCHQAAESGWLQPFEALITRSWDITNIHINKNNMDGVNADIDHYWNTYGQRPIWVTEFACVDDSNNNFIPCTDQGEIDSFISQIVTLFESDSRIMGYAYSDGYGLGDVWPTVSNGQLSASGQAYLSALKARG